MIMIRQNHPSIAFHARLIEFREQLIQQLLPLCSDPEVAHMLECRRCDQVPAIDILRMWRRVKGTTVAIPITPHLCLLLVCQFPVLVHTSFVVAQFIARWTASLVKS